MFLTVKNVVVFLNIAVTTLKGGGGITCTRENSSSLPQWNKKTGFWAKVSLLVCNWL